MNTMKVNMTVDIHKPQTRLNVLRWRFKNWLQRAIRDFILYRILIHRDDICWADAVMWAIYWDAHDFRELFDLPATAKDCEENAPCYCMRFPK